MMPIPGAPEITDVHGRRLLARADHLERVSDRIETLAVDDGAWRGPAADRVADLVQRVPETLRAAARRYAGGGRALVSFASGHADAQARATAAIRAHDDAVADRTRWDLRIDAEASRPAPDASWLTMLGRWRLDAAERVMTAERRYAAAWHDFHVADGLCADSLDATAALDDLGDPLAYRGLTRVSEAAGSAALHLGIAGTALRAAGPVGAGLSLASLAASGVQLGAQVTVKGVWGDGDWTAIGVNAAWLVSGAVGTAADRGSILRLHEARHGATGPKPVLERLGAGMSDVGRTPLGPVYGPRGGRGSPGEPGTYAAAADLALLGARRMIGVAAYRTARRQGAGAVALKSASDVEEAASTASAVTGLLGTRPRPARPALGHRTGRSTPSVRPDRAEVPRGQPRRS